MNPVAAIQAIIACVIAFVLGALISGVAVYGWAHAKGAASHLEAVGALKTSVDSCNVAAGEAKKAVDTEAKEGKDREARLSAAIADGARIAAQSARARSTTLSTPIRGNDECERVKNAVEDHFWGGRK